MNSNYNYPEILAWLENKDLILRGGQPVAVRYKK
jgi:hypothetical protein